MKMFGSSEMQLALGVTLLTVKELTRICKVIDLSPWEINGHNRRKKGKTPMFSRNSQSALII